jgi:hypothetical protein
MTVTARLRFVIIAILLSMAYYYLVVYIVGWEAAQRIPGWWLGTFPSRRVSFIAWSVVAHSLAVLFAAFPISVVAVIWFRKNAVLLGLIAASIACVAAIVPALTPTIWPLIWGNERVFFVTDQIKLISAVPFLAWVLRRASSNNRLEQPVGSSDERKG